MNKDDEIRYLKSRLFAAESVAALTGWTASDHATTRGKALHELWAQWAAFPGVSTDAADYPHLSDDALLYYAARRDETRARTLRQVNGGA